ncbi:spore protease YyaC [Staphylospora marina]|uniref:spore protease YyaC n=1 Tax=Staphylospora marina TaxID=2490858 RepID=UPI000F5BEB7E|nr:spore protease YyaC [Staphylospora marina]
MRDVQQAAESSFEFPYRVQHSWPDADLHFSEQLASLLERHGPCAELICVCIGTDRSTGDSLGPLVGSFLSRHPRPRFRVYGTLDEPVHALNLSSTLETIRERHPDALVIAVDACLGQSRSVGWIQVGPGPVKPGAGVNKQLPEVGDIHITGIVNVSGFMEYFVLQNTRLSLVMNMAEVIASAIIKAVDRTRIPLH